ncbi:hypothetical protein ACFL0T_02700 [Candidatus Omnitrophota bacterium]
MVKRILRVLTLLLLVIFISSSGFAKGPELLALRNKIHQESQIIQPLIANTQDIYILNTLWDACMQTITQLDAYFFMLGIFRENKDERDPSAPSGPQDEASLREKTPRGLNYLIKWTEIMKQTTELNLKSLASFNEPNEAKTKVEIKRLVDHYKKLNELLRTEDKKLRAIRKTAK